MTRAIMSRQLPGLMLVAVVLSASGCLLAVPVAINYYQSTREYVATAEVGKDAETVYRTAVKEAQARASTIRIVRRNDSGRLLEITDGVQTASIKAVSLSRERTEVVVVADVSKGGKEKEQELALRIIRIVADSLGVRYEITQK